MAANSNAFFWQKNPSLGFKENDLNPFKDATFLPTLAAAMEEQENTVNNFSEVLNTEN